ncbi:MAG: transporter substrate-binding protein, partial [Campylobacterales bacterium]|nr:transporter substrate-binding protein [Campylobacterales bacterium]
MRFFSIVLFVILFILLSLYIFIKQKEDTIKIGVLYSKTGTMKSEESVIYDMLNFAVEELNQNGGVLNKKVEIVEYDGASEPMEFEKGAKVFIDNGIKVIFGCWTSASRKAVKEIIEDNDALLFYPVQYEGVESSKDIVYLGSTPNQQ